MIYKLIYPTKNNLTESYKKFTVFCFLLCHLSDGVIGYPCTSASQCMYAECRALACNGRTSQIYCETGSCLAVNCGYGMSWCPSPACTVPLGYYCPSGTLTQTICPAGSYCTGGTKQPILCDALCTAPGNYEKTACSSSVNRVCGFCNNNVTNSVFTGNGTNISSCPWKCSNNYFRVNNTCISCSSCWVGQFTGPECSVCYATEANMSNINSNVFASESTCNSGTYSISYASTACLTCPSNQFRNLTMTWAPVSLDYGGHSDCRYTDRWIWNQPVYICSDSWAIWWYWYEWIYAFGENFIGGSVGYADIVNIGAYYNGEPAPITALIAQSTNIQWCLNCSACRSGTFMSVSCTGSQDAICTPCAVGKFSSEPSSLACLNCTAGTFMPVTGASVCLNCSAGNYSGSGASSCMQCAAGYSSSEASAVCEKLPPCQIGYYGLTPDCIKCPPNTNSTLNHTLTLLDCRCLSGFVCTYNKRIHVVLTFKNISWEMLNLTSLSQSVVIDAIAAAAGVFKESVHINGVYTGKRRLLESGETLSHKMFIIVSGADNFNVGAAYSLLGNVDAHIAWEHKHTVRVTVLKG